MIRWDNIDSLFLHMDNGVRMDLNGVLVFVRVAQLGSFSKAGLEMGIPKSTISKKISDLETHLKTTLLRRTTRSLQLTEMGKAFFEQASKGLSELKSAEINAQSTSDEPTGLLRVTAVADFATQVLSPIFGGFLKKYPKVTLELVLTDRVLDLVNDNIDIAVRIGKMSDSNLISRKLGIHRYRLLASPSYLKTHSELKNPDNLKNHTCLVFAPIPELLNWQLKAGAFKSTVDIKGQFISNSASAVKALAIDGAGIALLPLPICLNEIESKKLQIVLPSWGLQDAPVNFVFQNYLFVPPKITAFMDYVGERLKPLLQ